MSDIVSGSTRVRYMGRELELEQSLDSHSGFKNVRQVRPNKQGPQF